MKTSPQPAEFTKSAWPKTGPSGEAASVGAAVGVGFGVDVGGPVPVSEGLGKSADVGVGLGGAAQAATKRIEMSSPRLAMTVRTRARTVELHVCGNRLGAMTDERRGLDFGLIGAMSDIGFAIVLGVLLAFATEWIGDALPRPLVIALLYATPGLIGLLGVVANRPWLLIAGALPLFPAAGLSLTGATLVFLLPAVLMTAGAVRMIGRPDVPPTTLLHGVAAVAITVLVLVAGWSVLIGMTEYVCSPIAGGQSCTSGAISVGGLLVAAGCLVAALAIAVVGAGGRLKARREQ